MNKKFIDTILLIFFFILGFLLTQDIIFGKFGIKSGLILLIFVSVFIYNIKLLHFIYLVLSLYFIYPFCYRYLFFPRLPPLSNVLLIFLGYIMFNFIKKNKINKNKNVFDYMFIILTIFVLFSSIINSNNLLLTIKGLLEYFLPFIFLAIILSKNYISEKDQRKILNFLIFLLVIQIPTSFIQSIFRSGSPDGNNGTISFLPVGGTGVNAVLMTLLFTFFLLKLYNEGFSLKYFFVALIAPIPMITGSARFGFVLLIISLIITPFLISMYKRKKPISYLITTFIVSLFFIITIIISVRDYLPKIPIKGLDVTYRLLSEKELILGYGGYYKYSGRLGDYLYISTLHDNIFQKLFGFGGGSIISSKTVGGSGNIIKEITSGTFGVKLFSSLGLLGIFIFVFFVLIIANQVRKYLFLEKDKYFAIWGLSIIVFMFCIMFASLYTVIWCSQVGLSSFIILGILMNRYYFQKDTKLYENIRN